MTVLRNVSNFWVLFQAGRPVAWSAKAFAWNQNIDALMRSVKATAYRPHTTSASVALAASWRTQTRSQYGQSRNWSRAFWFASKFRSRNELMLSGCKMGGTAPGGGRAAAH